jgi:uncharacterized radical SAM superfamily Fe-S cluster-containing enzyme
MKILKTLLRYGLLRRLRRGERIYFYLTLKCSLSCSYCTGNFCDPFSATYKSLTLAGWKNILEQLQFRRDLPVQEIFISGGEPFLHKDCAALIDYLLANTNAMVTVFTNLVNNISKQQFRNSVRLRFVASYHSEMTTKAKAIWWENYGWLQAGGYHVVVEKFDNEIEPGKVKPLMNRDSQAEVDECYITHRHIFAPDGSYKKNLFEMLSGEYSNQL